MPQFNLHHTMAYHNIAQHTDLRGVGKVEESVLISELAMQGGHGRQLRRDSAPVYQQEKLLRVTLS